MTELERNHSITTMLMTTMLDAAMLLNGVQVTNEVQRSEKKSEF